MKVDSGRVGVITTTRLQAVEYHHVDADFVVWRITPSCGRLISGTKHLMIFLLIINAGWLILGNVAVTLSNLECQGIDVIDFYDTDCSSSLLPYSLAIVVIFDIFYTILFVTLCLNYGGCCDFEPSVFNIKKVSIKIWWVYILVLIFYGVLSVASIIVGSIYLRPCYDEDKIPLWIIIHGALTLLSLLLIAFKLKGYNYLQASWVQPTFMLVLPLFTVVSVKIISLAFGNLWLYRVGDDSCSDYHNVCDETLYTFTIVAIILFDLPVVVLFYVSLAMIILMAFLFNLTCCYYWCDGDEVEEDLVEKEAECRMSG
ncbi:hypothetical protein Hamer_G001515 [Homarus americanus]|uniref:Uncharacterized protein n=1 Tax=Homarus americanus TaxID=6706 RepID=A0A8J5TMT7_HOMAM|nr:hypothetical protein Hamer_G001515 [Homarus americanus]